MAKLTEVQAPGIGKVNLLSVGDWLKVIGGVLFLIIAVAAGQNAARAVGSRVPAIDTTIEQPWQSPVVKDASRKIEVI